MGTLHYFQMPMKIFWEWEMTVFKKERKWISPTWLVLSGDGKSLVAFEKKISYLHADYRKDNGGNNQAQKNHFKGKQACESLLELNEFLQVINLEIELPRVRCLQWGFVWLNLFTIYSISHTFLKHNLLN